MRNTFAMIALAAASIFTLSCAGVSRYARTDKVQFVLHLWIEDDPALSKADALKGCEEWLPKGVRCALTNSVLEADVRVKADMKKCVPDEKGNRTLAWAYKGGDVVFFMQCFKQADGTYDLHEFRSVITHEVGHELGIWEHVPQDCDDKDAKPLTHPSGKKVCGKAVMNPFYHSDIWFVTELDGMAFDLRDLEYSVIVPLTSNQPPPQPAPKRGDGPDCTYYAK